MSNSIDLKALQISIPSAYLNGKPTGYFYKSISEIIADGDLYEIAMVQEWFNRQILDSIGWKHTVELSVDVMEEALCLFANLGIQPTECIYKEQNNE